jgi:hypothetical protein
MAEVVGYLKDDATHGERIVLKTLRESLPSDYVVYVECPLRHKDTERMPDFIVLTRFGVVVLEVKDWVAVEQAGPSHARVRTRENKLVDHRSPVQSARDMACVLAQLLERSQERRPAGAQKIPWGYAAVLPNLPPAFISRLQVVWGENYVLGQDDLAPSYAVESLKRSIPVNKRRALRPEDLWHVRDVVYPIVSVTKVLPSGKVCRAVLDRDQERLVAEPVRPTDEQPAAPVVPVVQAAQAALIPASEVPIAYPPKPAAPPSDGLAGNLAVRLVRGVAGSGKTLVLCQRARFLAAQHPDWRICVVTYNRELTTGLARSLRGLRNVTVTNFDKLCAHLLGQSQPWHSPSDPEGWVANAMDCLPSVVRELGAGFVAQEIRWMKELGIRSRQTYLEAERRGRGREHALPRGSERRQGLYDVLEAYNAWLEGHRAWDWADIPHLVIQGLESGAIHSPLYDAVLIDEAQDFAPAWIGVLKRLLNPARGVLFLADDPSQSIYRYYSWREKGVPVVGRTRWLRIPYRNTREIFEAAYSVVRDDKELIQQLVEETGLTIAPDLASEHMRSGPRPLLRKFGSLAEEIDYVKNEILMLRREGLAAEDIALFCRRRAGVNRLMQAFRGTGVRVSTFHGPKGLEYEAVFLCQMQETFAPDEMDSEQAVSKERRLVYMAMTRARERLYLCYQGRWPAVLAAMRQYVD